VEIQPPRHTSLTEQGGPFVLAVGRIFLPNPQVKSTLSIHGFLSIFSETRYPNSPRYLLASLSFLPGTKWEEHHENLVKDEEGGHAIWSTHPIRAEVWWRDSNWTRTLKVSVSAKTMELFWGEFGNPLAEGAWLARRIAPRRLPGAVRISSPFVQVWAKL